MQRKIISTESKWFISPKPRNQANELIRMRMPTWLRLADSFLRIFNLHIDKNFSPVTSNIVSTDTQVAKELRIFRLYGQLNDENHFEIYHELFKLMYAKPLYRTEAEEIQNHYKSRIYYNNDIYLANVLYTENQFIGYFYVEDATVQRDDNRQFELKGLTTREALSSGLVKNGWYLFQFFKDENGKTKMSATELLWDNDIKYWGISAENYPDFQLLPATGQ